MANKKTNVIDWLNERPHLSISALERSADIPAGLVTKAMNGRQPLADKHIKNLVQVLKLYGYK